MYWGIMGIWGHLGHVLGNHGISVGSGTCTGISWGIMGYQWYGRSTGISWDISGTVGVLGYQGIMGYHGISGGYQGVHAGRWVPAPTMYPVPPLIALPTSNLAWGVRVRDSLLSRPTGEGYPS